ncbi:MAG: nucleotidyltransferase domain-containing protein [Elusimicrobia bacterium]|nr:nucleotidyltransferase domain-containing protein [Elusimicrobiota bacterium]
MILFGSCVSGRINRDSDIDMLIIKKTKKAYGKRWLEVGRLMRAINKKMPFEPIVLTPQELARQSLNNLFIREILKSGKVLYEKG